MAAVQSLSQTTTITQDEVAIEELKDDVTVVDNKDGADATLAELVKVQAERIKELEQTLSDTRKMIHSREQLLEQLQWKPKEDYYVWKNPTITDKTVRDAQERKLKTLLEQMRIMEKCLAERDQVMTAMLSGQLDNLHFNTPASSAGSTFDSPLGRTPAGSPHDSPAPKKASWWNFKKSSSSSNMKSSTNLNGSGMMGYSGFMTNSGAMSASGGIKSSTGSFTSSGSISPYYGSSPAPSHQSSPAVSRA